MGQKKSLYIADKQAEFLGEITSHRVNQVIGRYAELLDSEPPVDELLSVDEWAALFTARHPEPPLPDRLTPVQRARVLETLEAAWRKQGVN